MIYACDTLSPGKEAGCQIIPEPAEIRVKTKKTIPTQILIAKISDKTFTFALQKNLEIMFAVIKIAGQQFKVQPGQNLYVPHLSGKSGDKVEFSDVLLHDNEGKIAVGKEAKVTVKAEIVNDL